MPLAQNDRIIFSSQILGSTTQVAGITAAQNTLNGQTTKLQALDTANKNLFDPPNILVTQYQQELSALDGNGRTTVIEQDLQDAANRKIQNHFFPNDTATTVPSLASAHN